MSEPASEFDAIRTVHGALEPLDSEARVRILTYIGSLMGIDAGVIGASTVAADNEPNEEVKTNEDSEANIGEAPSFSSFAELYASAEPKSNAEKALVAGYWLQECQRGGNFTAAAANKELTHLGHKLGNITDAIDQMKSRKPMLMLQIKKSGNSRQARKLYKVSHEGVKRIEEMMGG